MNLTAHLQVLDPDTNEWHSWCNTSSFLTEGVSAIEQVCLHKAAQVDGLHLRCSQANLEEAQRVVDWLKIFRPSLQVKAVEGICQERDPYQWEEDYRASDSPNPDISLS